MARKSSTSLDQSDPMAYLRPAQDAEFVAELCVVDAKGRVTVTPIRARRLLIILQQAAQFVSEHGLLINNKEDNI